MKNLQLLSLIALLTISLAACNTIEGAGQDIEAGGDAIEGSARETKGY
jgi:entericidin B